jgi:hypothetical protein
VRLSAVRHVMLVVPSCLLLGSPAFGQAPAPATAAHQSVQLRNQIAVMEGVLERAVGVGISGAVNQMPDLFQGPGMWGVTPPRARGFKIDGYGVFFDVEVPSLPATTWSISILTRNNEIALVNEINQLRALVAQSVPEASKRVELTKSLDRVAARVSGAALSEPGVPPAPGATASLVSDATTPGPTRAPAPRMMPVRDPDAIYTGEVRKALTNVMLEQGITMQMAPEEWFTIAASQSRGGWGEPETMTLYLSIQGKDLAALRTRQITQEEAARRIIAKNY